MAVKSKAKKPAAKAKSSAKKPAKTGKSAAAKAPKSTTTAENSSIQRDTGRSGSFFLINGDRAFLPK